MKEEYIVVRKFNDKLNNNKEMNIGDKMTNLSAERIDELLGNNRNNKIYIRKDVKKVPTENN